MQQITISYKTILFTVFLLIGLYVLFEIRLVILLWFISFILATALNPFVNILETISIPRAIGVAITVLFTLFIVSLIVAGVVPTFVEQSSVLLKNLERFIPQLEIFELDSDFFSAQFERYSQTALNLLGIALGAFSNLFVIFSMFVLTVYMMIERQKVPSHLKKIFQNREREKKYLHLLETIEIRLGGWVRGEVALMVIVGTATFLGLYVLGVPFALPLALLAGLLELIPNVGPTLSAIPAIIIGLTVSPAVAIGVLILYVAIQQLESNFIVPMVMKQSVGINPIITLMLIMVGLTLGGVLGALLAVPLYISAEIVIKFMYQQSRPKKTNGLTGGVNT
jgi:predicted PurR-regulated permease PerM